MKIKIGERTFSASAKPKDLDVQLLAALGVSAAEMAAMLPGTPIAHHVAVALLPFLTDGDDIAPCELAAAISQAGLREVAAEVAQLYAAKGDGPATQPATGAAVTGNGGA